MIFLCYFRVRFHYGHPDVFDRLFHLTRGGVSKASKVINLSEDIFAGMCIIISFRFPNVKISSFFSTLGLQVSILHYVKATSLIMNIYKLVREEM